MIENLMNLLMFFLTLVFAIYGIYNILKYVYYPLNLSDDSFSDDSFMESIATITGSYTKDDTINEKTDTVGAIANDVIGNMLKMDSIDYEKIKAIDDNHLSKIANSIQTYSRIERGQLDAGDYPGIEAELNALLDAAKADLILESKNLFKHAK